MCWLHIPPPNSMHFEDHFLTRSPVQICGTVNKHLYWFALCEFNNLWNHVLSLSSLPSTSHLPNHLILINSLSYIHPIFLHSPVLITGALPKGWQGASTPERFQKREKLENMVYFHEKKKSIKLAFFVIFDKDLHSKGFYHNSTK